jgi:hypothetical protein
MRVGSARCGPAKLSYGVSRPTRQLARSLGSSSKRLPFHSFRGRDRKMSVGFPSIRIDGSNQSHHLWCNNGTWWLHYTVHFDHRVRRIRRSLRTRSLTEAIARRDKHLGEIAAKGELVPNRRPPRVSRAIASRLPTKGDKP